MLRILISALVLLAPTIAIPAAPDGAAAFKARCSKCHTARSMRAAVAKWPEDERSTRLDRFLAEHYAPEPADRKAIVDYLAAPRR